MTELIQSENRKLTPQQAEFIQSFLSEGAPAFQQLIAPPGSGKPVVVVEITRTLVLTAAARKILCFVSSLVVEETYRGLLKQYGLNLKFEYVDVLRFRELLTSVPVGASPWRSELFALIPLGFSEFERNFKSILQTKWDLVIFDSVLEKTGGFELVKKLVEKKNTKRMLIVEGMVQLTSKQATELKAMGIITTKWTFDAKRHADAAGIELKFGTVEYFRSPQESKFIENYTHLVKETSDTDFKETIRLRLASSSLYAAEQSVRRLRNSLVYKNNFDLQDESNWDEIVKERHGINNQPIQESRPDVPNLLREIDNTLAAYNLILTDSKFDALQGYIHNIHLDRHILVQSSYAATISFLFSSLSEEMEKVYQVSNILPYERNISTLDKFGREGGVLIASTTFVIGVDLEIDELILYDIVNNPTLIRQNVAKLFRIRQEAPSQHPIEKRIIVLRDHSKVIPTEEKRLSQLRRIVRQLDA